METMDVVEEILHNDMNGTKIIQDGLVFMVAEFMDTFELIWEEMGITSSVKKNRIDVILQHVRMLFVEMLNDEKEFQTELRSSIASYEKDLLELAHELGEVPYQASGDLKLVELEKSLRTKLNGWNMEKYQRLKSLKKHRETEEMLCKRLELPAHDAGIVEIPTVKQLSEIEENIKYMENQLAEAIEAFKKIRQAVSNLWGDLEMVPGTDFERDLARDDSEASFVLSRNNLNVLKELQTKLEKEQKENFGKAARLREQLKRLCTKLDIDESEQQRASTFCAGFKPSAIQKLREEVNRLEALKVQHIQKFIDGSRKELAEMWDKCFFGEAQRGEFTPAFDENYNEETLAIHEHQVEVMRNYYAANVEIFKLVEKRENMWKKFLEFESKENDPNRLFLNRGGALLKEMKTRNSVQKGLPKVEEELKKVIVLWEKENEKHFLINGEKYLEVIEQQWAIHEQEKKQLKEERQKAKQETIKKEMFTGAKPSTPAKRALTPAKTPISKRLRSNLKSNSTTNSTATTPSRLTCSSVFRSPLTQRANVTSAMSKPPKCSGGKVTKNPRRRSSRISKKFIMKRKSKAPNAGSSSGSSRDSTVIIGQSGGRRRANESLSSCTSYSEFTSGLRNQQADDAALNSTRSQMVTFV